MIDLSLNELLILMPVVTTAVVSIINAWHGRGQRQRLDTNTELTAQTRESVSKVQSLVNGQSEVLKVALHAALARTQALEAELAALRAPRLPAPFAPKPPGEA